MTLKPFTSLDAVAAPIDWANVDTDQIAPVRFLRRPRVEGYGDVLFHDLRFSSPGVERPDFILNRAAYRSAAILVADRNFGTGSSREQAVWALADNGIRCVIAAGFGDIFFNNAVKHGVLLINEDAEVLGEERRFLLANSGARIQIDLARQTWQRAGGEVRHFEIDPARKRKLLLGLDDIELTLRHRREIAEFAGQYRAKRPWLFA